MAENEVEYLLSIREIVLETCNIEKCIQYCFDHGIFKKECIFAKCNIPMVTRMTKSTKDGREWYCSKYKSCISI
jgi:hypothetical protein